MLRAVVSGLFLQSRLINENDVQSEHILSYHVMFVSSVWPTLTNGVRGGIETRLDKQLYPEYIGHKLRGP